MNSPNIFFFSSSYNSDKSAVPVLVCTADWKEIMKGKLGVGGALKIEYAGSRLSGRPTMYGKPAWKIFAEYKFSDDGDVHKEELEGGQDAKVLTKTISIPIEAKKLVIWFKHWSYYGGTKYDSDYGKNYLFAITKPSIVFDSAYGETVHGALKAGGKFDVLYDSARLAKHAEITAEMKFAEHGHVFSKKLSGIVSIDKVTTYQHAVVDIPVKAKSVIMWFYHVVNGKKKYDSDYGKNYHFELAH